MVGLPGACSVRARPKQASPAQPAHTFPRVPFDHHPSSYDRLSGRGPIIPLHTRPPQSCAAPTVSEAIPAHVCWWPCDGERHRVGLTRRRPCLSPDRLSHDTHCFHWWSESECSVVSAPCGAVRSVSAHLPSSCWRLASPATHPSLLQSTQTPREDIRPDSSHNNTVVLSSPPRNPHTPISGEPYTAPA